MKIGAADVDRDIARFNEAVEPMELMPTRTPDEARARGRYVLENDERVATPLSDSERDESLSLIRWFRRRYPTPGERLAYARRAYRRWSAVQGQ